MEAIGNAFLTPPSLPNHYFSPPHPQHPYYPLESPSPHMFSPPSHKFLPPPPPPPPSHMLSPPLPPSHMFSPPPPGIQISPPPPHTMPPPMAPPSPDSHTAIIVVFASLCSLAFVALLAAVLFCLKKKRKKMGIEKETLNVEDHIHVHESIAQGPHGEKLDTLTIDEDIKAQEIIKKDELVFEGSHAPRIGQGGSVAAAQKPSTSSS